MAIAIRRHDGHVTLVIENAETLAQAFFSSDQSSAGPNSLDDYINRGISLPNRIVAADITAINTTVRARGKRVEWEAFTLVDNDLSELAAIDPTWSLFEMTVTDWQLSNCTTT